MTKEQQFYQALEGIFIGAPIEGESGYINLMRIKSRYYQTGVFPQLQKDIEEALQPFPDFRDELFLKLYTFFKRYFSKSGSIYFDSTPADQNIYEKVYTDDRDVMLFWKTHMLYYVKTDRLFKPLDTEIDGIKFHFDVSTLEHKRANEKRDIIYEFKEMKDNVLTFNVYYSEKGRKTNTDHILRALTKAKVKISEDTLEKAFRIFEKQSEVDYFINKNAKAFLREQFDLWLYQYVFSGESQWTETRIKQLQVLKDMAYKIIDFISQFEDELVSIWNKPKFVFNSNYVITLDRLLAVACHCQARSAEAISNSKGIELIQKIINHPNFAQQVAEWKQLGIVNDSFIPSAILNPSSAIQSPSPVTPTPSSVIQSPTPVILNAVKDLASEESLALNQKYTHLPIDTKYFKDLELSILGLFDDLDNALDGWLIKSENYQALNTILPKFKERVQTIYIDPPFNKEQDADYFYSVKYKDSTWITMLEDRLWIAQDILTDLGSIYVKCDYNGNMFVRTLMNEIFGADNFRSDITWKRFTGTKIQRQHLAIVTDTVYCYTKTDEYIYEQQYKRYKKEYINNFFKFEDENGKYCIRNFYSEGDGPSRIFFGKSISPPKGHHWRYKQDNIDDLIKKGRIVLDKNGFPKLKMYLNEMKGDPYDSLLDEMHVVQGSSKESRSFPTQNPEKLLRILIESSSYPSHVVLDFFLGSGTTIAAAHKLNRKWIGIELGEHYDSIALLRMKEVLAGKGNHEPCGISNEVNWQGGGFFKYYELEQYEDTLRKVQYEDSDLFDSASQDPYNQYVFLRDLKMLEALEIDYENNEVKVDLRKLYPSIDVPEILSNLLGKYIKKIRRNEVEFENGDKIDLNNLDYKLIKPLIWW